MLKTTLKSMSSTQFFSKSVYYLIFCLLVSTNTIGSEPLDIRAYEASDQCDETIAQVRVTVNNVGDGGILSVELYHDPKNFLNKKGRTRRIRIPAEEGHSTVCFGVEEPGTFAVAAYHDVDGNRKLNKRWNKMPKEPFGLSNNPRLKFGFPKFSKSAFTTDSLGANISVDLQSPK